MPTIFGRRRADVEEAQLPENTTQQEGSAPGMGASAPGQPAEPVLPRPGPAPAPQGVPQGAGQLPPPAILGRLLGAQRPAGNPVGALRTGPDVGMETGSRLPIGDREISEAASILQKYKDGKANLESRVVEDELWWELRHWEAIGRNRSVASRADNCGRCDPPSNRPGPEPTSGWLFNALLNKHADAMDNYPEPVVLPRERSDEQSAQVLSSVLPVILEYNDYEQVYSDNWWEKLKHGTAVYGVFWNSQKENGLGDIDVKPIDLLKLYWEPGITDIQQSRNLFLVELVDEDLLEQQYPEFKGKLGGGAVDVKQYLYDDQVDTSNKAVVVDWYYKVRNASGRQILHYCKFCNNTLLFASENEEEYRERGWYDHGLYPVVLDVLFPEKGTPVGFGYIAVCKDPQLYIDKLSANILESADMATRKRWFISDSTGINEQEFLDVSKPFVHVQGDLDERRLQEIVNTPISAVYLDIMQLKIEEMKDTSGNRDVNNGSTGSGITAAAAISALQEAGNKTSRDMISASYRAHVQVNSMCLELIRQFYDETRSFRITQPNQTDYTFVQMNNADLRDQPIGTDSEGAMLYRRPIFDLKIKAQKKNPFSRMEQNERAKELYGLGFFNPERAQEAMGALEMMEFEGIDKVRERVQQGQTLLNMMQQMMQQMDQMALIIQTLTGKDMGINGQQQGAAAGAPGNTVSSAYQAEGSEKGLAAAAKRAQTPMTSYGDRLAKRSSPDMTAANNAANPGTR